MRNSRTSRMPRGGRTLKAEYTIARLDIKTGDVIVVTIPHNASAQQCGNMVSYIQGIIPGHPVLILVNGIKIDVLSPTKEP